MTLDVYTTVPHYVPAPPTNEDLPWADLGIIDLSKAATPEGRNELAVIIRDALHHIGFFYVINHGLSQSQTDRIFDIADIPFSQVSDQEKREYEGKIIETGSYQGYKPRKFWHINGGVQDEVEAYSINRDVLKKEHPEALRAYLPEIQDFANHNHEVLNNILTLLAIGLELPEDTFVKQHGSRVIGESDVGFMKYYPRDAVEEQNAQQVWLKGHTDIGSITILWSQPVSGLQILSPDGRWRWIRHIENALVVNAGDCMEFLSGGFYKATIHRVFQPPIDQRGCTRLGAFYFAFPDEGVKLLPVSDSPVLERVGIQRRFEDEDAPTVENYRTARVATYGKTILKPSQDKAIEEEVVSGVVVKHYN